MKTGPKMKVTFIFPADKNSWQTISKFQTEEEVSFKGLQVNTSGPLTKPPIKGPLACRETMRTENPHFPILPWKLKKQVNQQWAQACFKIWTLNSINFWQGSKQPPHRSLGPKQNIMQNKIKFSSWLQSKIINSSSFNQLSICKSDQLQQFVATQHCWVSNPRPCLATPYPFSGWWSGVYEYT